MPERVSGPPPLMLPGAALGSLAARFCWQGQHFRLWTVPERVSGPALGSLAAHLGASQLVSAGRGSTSGSGRYPSAFRGPPLDAARRSTWEPRGSLGSLAARFCWQGQHFRLWTVPERVSGPPPLIQHLGASRLVSAGRGSTSGSGRYPSAFRGPLLIGSLAARFCWQGHTHTRHTHVDSQQTHSIDAHTFAHGARARFTLDTHLGASRLVSAGRGSTSGSGRCPSAFRGPPP